MKLRTDSMTRVGNTIQKVGEVTDFIFKFQLQTIQNTGNLKDWWEKETGEEYNDRAQCIIDQYRDGLKRVPQVARTLQAS